MKNFNSDRREGGFKGGYAGGKPSYEKKVWSKDRPQAMFKATCSECGKPCDVPFRPTGEKPVYCNDCFNKKRDPSDTRVSRPAFDTRASKAYASAPRDFNDRFAPRPDARPAFKPAANDFQLKEINNKLDRLVAAVERMTAATLVASRAETAIEVQSPKPVKKGVKAKKKVIAKKKE